MLKNAEEIGLDTRLEQQLALHRPGWTLPRAFYQDREIFDLELKSIFSRFWLFVGHVSQIPHPGDYFTYQIGDDPLIILRDESNEIAAYFNTCRHRGSVVCAEPSGHVKNLVCPYHQWVYRLDGSLAAARHMPPEFDKSSFSLHRAHSRTMEGLIFVSLAQKPPDFAGVERDVIPQLSPHRLEEAKVCQTRQYEVHANWKLLDENARECYHCPSSHPEYCRAVISAAAVNSTFKANQYRTIKESREAHWRSLGMETEAKPFRPGNWHSVARVPFQPGVVTQSLDGQPVAPLMGDLTERDMGVLGIGIYPNLLFQANSDHAVCLRFTPVRPTVTKVDMSWLVHKDAIEGVDYRIESVEAVWKATAEQDWQLCENNQRGINSSRYEPGPYSTIEWGCEHFVEWYLNNLHPQPER